MKGKIQNNEIPIDKYKINTKLSKDPKVIQMVKSMPQVQVALRLREEEKVIKAGSVITYVITAAKDDGDNSTVAERARAIQNYFQKDPDLKPDANYYLEKQIFAPVERLLERIEGIDMVRVATSLGIDTKRYILRVRTVTQTEKYFQLNQTFLTKRFRATSYLVLHCKCGSSFRFGESWQQKHTKSHSMVFVAQSATIHFQLLN